MHVRRGCMGCAALWLCCVYGLAQARGSTRHRIRSVHRSPAKTHPNIAIVGDNFTINGQPIRIISGSLHYFRVPAAYWRDRLHKLKAAGLNAVATYVEWSFHEAEERQYSFEGDRDVAAFIRIAADEGLHVLLRPGPYICAERDLISAYSRKTTPYRASIFSTADPMQQSFKALRRYIPHGPLMNSEFYSGWLTHWGESFQRVSTDSFLATLEDMLDLAINVNTYVFFGGTNFEFTAGANYDGTYTPDITSYDYDAPLSEAGDPTPKYFAIRDALAKHNPQVRDIDPPVYSNKSAYGTILLNKRFRLLSSVGRHKLGKKYPYVVGSKLPTYEELRQRSGLMLYETYLGETKQGTLLKIRKPRDRIHVFIDGTFYGTISRTKKNYTTPVQTKPNSVLSLLVENQGRINFGCGIHDYKGILSRVSIDRQVLHGSWLVTGFPLQNLDGIVTAASDDGEAIEGPILFDGYFTIPENEQPQDTYFDTTKWGKGYIWVNGHNLGRYWPDTGPQVTLYVPGCWLRAPNHVQLLELDRAPATTAIRSINYPIL